MQRMRVRRGAVMALSRTYFRMPQLRNGQKLSGETLVSETPDIGLPVTALAAKSDFSRKPAKTIRAGLGKRPGPNYKKSQQTHENF